jgi:ketosteroid isomerase-like protein
MRRLAMLVMASVCGISCSRSTDDFQPETIVALERGALDRWGKGDPQGFFDIMAADQTYFDPTTAKRIDGQDALKKYFAPFTGKIKIEKAEMIDPKVQRSGDLAVLTFNLVNYGAQMDGGPKTTARWNSTEVFQRLNGSWKIVHSHWSYVKPVLKEGATSQNVRTGRRSAPTTSVLANSFADDSAACLAWSCRIRRSVAATPAGIQPEP